MRWKAKASVVNYFRNFVAKTEELSSPWSVHIWIHKYDLPANLRMFIVYVWNKLHSDLSFN